jgi:hypothetical protein
MILKELYSIKAKADKLKFICEKANREEIIKNKMDLYGINKIYYKKNDNAILQKRHSVLPIVSKSPIQLADDEILAVINSCGVMDNHLDVSMNGSWTKTIQERGNQLKAVLDHTYKITSLFAENKGNMVIKMPILDLGYDKAGMTEVWAMKIKPNSEEILMKYQTGQITQHSAGLQYVKIRMAVNDESDEEGYKTWLSTIDQVINRDFAEEVGFYFPIDEQKAIEGSAVVFGSNPYTPAFTNKKSLENKEPLKNTPKVKPIDKVLLQNLLNKI